MCGAVGIGYSLIFQSLAVRQPAWSEDPRGQCSERETADVRHISHTAALHLRQSADLAEELGQEPEPNQDDGRDKGHAREPANSSIKTRALAANQQECDNWKFQGASGSVTKRDHGRSFALLNVESIYVVRSYAVTLFLTAIPFRALSHGERQDFLYDTKDSWRV